MPTDGAAMFDLGDTNLLLPLLRAAFVAALFSAFGALLFIWLVAPQGLKLVGASGADAIEGRCLRLVRRAWSRHFSRCLAGSCSKHPTCQMRQMRPTLLRQFPQCCSKQASGTISPPRRFQCSPRSCFSQRGRSDGGLRAWGWRGSLLPFRPATATPSPWNMARAYCSMRKDCTFLPAVPGLADYCRC